VDRFPDGLVTLGDAACRLNPVYGQGMTVAAKSAVLLHRLLRARATQTRPLRGFSKAFFQETSAIIDTPWQLGVISDFVYSHTRGERPVELTRALQFNRALTELAWQNEAVHRLVTEIGQLLKPWAALQDHVLLRHMEVDRKAA
jgi:2-polyprenyl-6-methoxyphenol hydroxylase-like FAD-dependent oxidoreductase